MSPAETRVIPQRVTFNGQPTIGVLIARPIQDQDIRNASAILVGRQVTRALNLSSELVRAYIMDTFKSIIRTSLEPSLRDAKVEMS